MFFNPPFSTISLSFGFLSAIIFAYRTYQSHLKIKLPFTRYFFLASISFCILMGMFGLGTLFFPRNFELWKNIDSFAHIFVVTTLAYLCRFFLALVKNPRERTIFWIFFVFGQVFTLIDFVYPRVPYLAPPGVIVWNNHPIVGIGLGIVILAVTSLLAIYCFTKGGAKEFLIRVRLLLFAALFGLIGLGGGIITVFTNPLLVLIGDVLIMAGALGMLLASLLGYFAKTELS